MKERSEFYSMSSYKWHKGFYNDEDYEKTLSNIYYNDFWEVPEEEFVYSDANALLHGSCQIFALSLKKVLKYNAYIIQENNKTGFHAFCQIYKQGILYYVDARGITTSFDEFMEVAGCFIHDEFTIRPVASEDIEEWKKEDYFEEACAFAEAVIRKYMKCFTL